MRRFFLWLIAGLLVFGGLTGTLSYLAALAINDDREWVTAEYGSVFAFSVVGLIAGVIAILALWGRLPRSVRLPGEWVTFSLFIVSVVTGIVVVLSGTFLIAGPFLALLAGSSLFLFLGRLITRWSPERPVGSRGFVLPALWGAIGAPLLAGTVQIATVLLLIFSATGGIYLADAALLDNIENWITGTLEMTDLSVIQTPTVTFAAIAVLGITAPLTEELTKFLGVYFLFRKRVATRYGLFIAGAASGLGFAIVETLGYSLMANETWPQVMLLRAPVALIHIAATTIVALGWYQHRQHGGYALVGYFALSVILHAAWNSLFVSMMIAAAGIDTADTVSPVTALMVLVMVGAMGALLVASTLWIVGHARRLGRESEPMSDTQGLPPTTQAPSHVYSLRT